MYALILEAVGMYGRELYQLLPAFILGVGLAATIKTFKWDLKLRAYMRDSGAATIPLAVFLGLFSPLCACRGPAHRHSSGCVGVSPCRHCWPCSPPLRS